MSKQLDIEVECLAAKMYEEHHAGRSLHVPWVRRCSTVKDGYRATARRALMARKLETA